jgi:hypothetical protein
MSELDADESDYRPAFVFAGIVVVFAAFNALSTWMLQDSNSEYGIAMYVGVFVSEVLLFAAWTALGTGTIATRLPVILPCLLMLFIAPGLTSKSFADTQLAEFIVTVAVGLVLFAIFAAVFAATRKFPGLRVEQLSGAPLVAATRVRFGMKYLLILITVYAILLGMAMQLRFRTDPPPPSFINFGLDFTIYFTSVGGAAVAGMLLPTLAIPLYVLHTRFSHRAERYALAFWLAVTLIAVGIGIFYLKGQPTEVIASVLLMQFGGALTGALVALPLRMAGFRIVRRRPAMTRPEIAAT